MPPPTSKEQILEKMQELDTTLQSAIRVRTELWSMIVNFPDTKLFVNIEIPLTFYDKGNLISWGNDSECFSPSTFRFLQQLWLAPDHTLSKNAVRRDVLEDKHAREEAIWTCVKRARQELEAVDFPYEIKTLYGKGYRLSAVS